MRKVIINFFVFILLSNNAFSACHVSQKTKSEIVSYLCYRSDILPEAFKGFDCSHKRKDEFVDSEKLSYFYVVALKKCGLFKEAAVMETSLYDIADISESLSTCLPQSIPYRKILDHEFEKIKENTKYYGCRSKINAMGQTMYGMTYFLRGIDKEPSVPNFKKNMLNPLGVELTPSGDIIERKE